LAKVQDAIEAVAVLHRKVFLPSQQHNREEISTIEETGGEENTDEILKGCRNKRIISIMFRHSN
jgi:hypothetical protein